MKWEFHAIKDVYEGLYDGPHATPPVCDDGAIFLGISNISENGHLDFSGIKYISEADLPRWTKRVTPKAGDIVFSYEAGLNRYAIIPEEFHGCLGRRMALIRPNEKKALGKFLYYYFFSTQWRETIAANTIIGTTVDRIPLIKFPKFPVSLPDLNVQRRIVDTLSAYDDLIEVNNKRIKVLEQMGENLYKEWFVRFRFPGHETAEFENGLPKGWMLKRADEVITFNPNLSVKDQTQFTIIPMEALSTTSMVLDSTCFVLQDTISGRRSQNGDTLLAKITPCLENGKTGFVMGMPDGEVFGGSTEFVVMRSKALNPYYVYWLARSYYFRQTAILSMNGADGRQRVDEDKLKSMKIIQPSKAVLNQFETVMSPIFDTVHKMVQSNHYLAKQRDLLLPRLMSGKMEV